MYNYLSNNQLIGIPRIVELIEDENKLYIIEEYISGKSFREILNTYNRITEDKVIIYINQLCDILSPLHKLQPAIIHRDIKPSNLILSSENKVILIDFNAAKKSNDEKRQDTVLIGTIGYAAPEQYGFGISTAATDIYAIGILINELATGKLPTEEKCFSSLAKIIDKCVQIEPLNRYQSVEDLKNDLNGITKLSFKISQIRPLFIPGFRGNNIFIILIALIWYVFITIFCFTLVFTNVANNMELLSNRFASYLLFVSLTLFYGNYRNVLDHFPLTNSKNLFVKVIGLILGFFVIFISVLITLLILIKIF